MSDLNERLKPQNSQKKTLEKLHGIDFGNNFWHMIPKAQVSKETTENSTSIHNKNSHQSLYRGNISQHNTGQL